MTMDYSGGPYDVSEELLLYIMEYRKSPEDSGAFITGIPETDPNRNRRAWSMLNMDTGQEVTARMGPAPYVFSQQSMSKPTAACYAMSLLRGGLNEFKQQVGNEFSGKIYNGLNFDATPKPQNFSDNVGALKVWDLIASRTGPTEDPFLGYLRWFRGITGTAVDPKAGMAYGEYREEGTNWDLLRVLGIQQGDPRFKRVYLSYCKACSVQVTVEEMATVFGVIAGYGKNPRTRQLSVPADVAGHVMDGMRQHGAYNESQIYSTKAGLWSKTGVDGGIMGRVQNHSRWVFCCQHPELNGAGNSGEALKWITDLSRLRLEWPRVPRAGGPLPPNTPTGEVLDRRLRGLMTPQSITALEEKIAAHIQAQNIPAKRGFYLKLNPKGKRLTGDDLPKGGTAIHEARDTMGTFKRYYYMPDTHYLHKIVVEPLSAGYYNARGNNPFITG